MIVGQLENLQYFNLKNSFLQNEIYINDNLLYILLYCIYLLLITIKIIVIKYL